jgi:branched-chain amino acid transport system ATP-binding protein
MPALLEIDDLHVAYGKVEAVHGVSLAVGAARIVTVIGPNGAGRRHCWRRSWVCCHRAER